MKISYPLIPTLTIFRKFGVSCFLVTPILRFTLLPYYRQFVGISLRSSCCTKIWFQTVFYDFECSHEFQTLCEKCLDTEFFLVRIFLYSKLNTEIYSVKLCIQSEYRKILTRETSVFGTVKDAKIFIILSLYEKIRARGKLAFWHIVRSVVQFSSIEYISTNLTRI